VNRNEQPRRDADPAVGSETASAVESARAHASDLIDAAKLLSDPFPHFAYHFAVLALEEIGRGVLLVVRASTGETQENNGGLDAAMEDHVQKLFWALWSPSSSERVSGEQIEEFRELARQIHERRKGALYFDPTAATLPRDAVRSAEAATVISLAESRLGMELGKNWVRVGSEEADNARFFSEAAMDSRWREFIFSAGSLAKFGELRDVREWIAWLRAQIEDAEHSALEAAQREITRATPASDEEARLEKWSMRLRFFSESHSIRASVLNSWNDGIEWMKLRRATANELIVDLVMPRAVLAASVWGSGYVLAQRLLLALNIGTLGFFWWRPRTDTARYYERLRDLETGDEVVVERSPPLTVDWGERQVLNERALSRVMTCLAMLPSEPEHPANEALVHYLRGLALIAKTDVHLQLERNTAETFYLALREGMSAYGDWDGVQPFAQRFEEFASRFFTEEEDSPTYVTAVQLMEGGRLADVQLPFDKAVMMKGLADAYFLQKFEQLASERAEAERADANDGPRDDG
jgi:AbiV family abortive infection protein